MESSSRGYVAADGTSGRSRARRLAVGCLAIAGFIMFAAAPAAAGHKHKHKHKHNHHHHYEYSYGHGYRYAPPPTVIYVPARPVYVPPPPPVYYQPAPVIYGPPSLNVIIPLDFD